MTIRRAAAGDAAKLYKLESKIFTKENYPLSKSSFRYHIKNNMLYIAEVNEEVIGYILVLIKRKNAKLYSIAVDSLYRGRNIAKKFLKTVSKELVSLGFEKFLLEVRVDNERAISLYKKAGFNIIKKLDSFYLDRCDAYLMELKYADETLQRTL